LGSGKFFGEVALLARFLFFSDFFARIDMF